MVRTKLTAKRIPHLPDWLINRRKKLKNKRPFKIKAALPEQRQADIKKKWQRNQNDQRTS